MTEAKRIELHLNTSDTFRTITTPQGKVVTEFSLSSIGTHYYEQYLNTLRNSAAIYPYNHVVLIDDNQCCVVLDTNKGS